MSARTGSCGPVLVVDDDEALWVSITALLTREGSRVIRVGSGEDALHAAELERPSLVVLEVGLPGVSGYEVCRFLRERFGRSLPIVFLSAGRTEPLDRVAGLLIGADDYLVKPIAPDELLVRIRALVGRAPAGARNGLTPREQEVLALLADGLSQAEIAGVLVIAPKTVGTHIERILEKLGVHSRAEAVAAAYRQALVRA
jgi:DNA-binding NarL/FixJ family response regulator